MIDFEPLLIILVLAISLGSAYIWFKIWRIARGGSLAWIALMLVALSVFVSELFPGIFEYLFAFDKETTILLMTFFSLIKMVFLFTAGYLFYQSIKEK